MSRFWVDTAGKLIIITDDTQDKSSDGLIEVPSTSPSEKHVWVDGHWIIPVLTPQELREQMPDKTPREFRDILIDEDILTDASPDEVTAAIQQIPFDKERTKALNAWHNMTTASRTDPYIDMIGAMFGLTPEDIDLLWVTDNES